MSCPFPQMPLVHSLLQLLLESEISGILETRICFLQTPYLLGECASEIVEPLLVKHLHMGIKKVPFSKTPIINCLIDATAFLKSQSSSIGIIIYKL